MNDVTQVRWGVGEKRALEACLAKLQKLAPGRVWTMPDVLRVLVTAYGAGLTPAELLESHAARDTERAPKGDE